MKYCKNIEQLEFSYMVIGMKNGITSWSLQIQLPHDPAIFTPAYLPKRNENIWPRQDLCQNVHSSLIHDNTKLENPNYPSSKEWANYGIFTMEYYSAIKQWITGMQNNMDESQKHSSWVKEANHLGGKKDKTL